MVPTAVQQTVVPGLPAAAVGHTPIIWSSEPVAAANAAGQLVQQQQQSCRPMRADRLEICRDFLRSTCTRNDMLKEGRASEKMNGSLCKYAHPEKVNNQWSQK